MYLPKLFTELRSYSKEKALGDIFAGFTIGILALPLAMAFAIASNLPPARGIFTAIVAGFLISAFGGSKVQIGGPTGAFVVIISSIVSQYGYSGLVVCTIIAGFILILLGVFRLGNLIRFIPFPVITGFTTGIAIIIFTSQISDLLGIKAKVVSTGLIDRFFEYVNNLKYLNPHAAVLGIGAIIIILFLQKKYPKLPAMLIGMSAMTLLAYVMNLNAETIGSCFGDLPSMLPVPSFPNINFSQIVFLAKPALTIAFLAAIESLLSASVADGMIGGNHRPNAELIGQGIANIGSVIFGGIPATGAIARTAANIKSGARTPVAGIVHSIVLVLFLLLFSPIVKLIPLATLAGILVVVSYNMSELHHFISIFKGARIEAFILIVTCIMTVFIDLTAAIEAGIILSFFLFVKRMSETSNVSSIKKTMRQFDDDVEDLHPINSREIPAGVEVFEIAGPFFFGMVDVFKNAIKNIDGYYPILIIRTRNVNVIDATGIHALRELFVRTHKAGTQLIFSGINKNVFSSFKKDGFIKEVGEENFCKNIDDALRRARQLLATQKPPVNYYYAGRRCYEHTHKL